MPSDSRFKVWVYTSSAFTFQGWVTRPVSISGTLRLHGLSAFTIVTRAADPMNQFLLDTTARVVLQYRGVAVFSGKVRDPSGSMIQGGTYSWQVQGDWRWTQNTTAWVRPSNPLNPTTLTANASTSLGQAYQDKTGTADGQVDGQTGYYKWTSTNPEAMVKALLTDNWISRLRLPVAVAANLNRGVALTAAQQPLVRFDTIESILLPILAAGGLQLNVLQDPAASQVAVDVRVPDTWPQTITGKSGIIVDGTWQRTYPTATRGILGGPGDDAARDFRGFQDATGLESTYADIIEVFKDATGAPVSWPTGLAEGLQVPKYLPLRSDTSSDVLAAYLAQYTQSATQALADGAAQVSVSVTLAETPTFRFGGTTGIQLGDRVNLQSAGGDSFSSQITEVDLAWSHDSGNTATPHVGDVSLSQPDRLIAQYLQRLARAQRWVSTSR